MSRLDKITVIETKADGTTTTKKGRKRCAKYTKLTADESVRAKQNIISLNDKLIKDKLTTAIASKKHRSSDNT